MQQGRGREPDSVALRSLGMVVGALEGALSKPCFPGVPMRNVLRLCSIGLAVVACCGSASATIPFTTFVSGTDLNTVLGNQATIGFAYAGDKFVGSVYFGTNNNQLYSTNLSGGAVQKFGAPIAGFTGEVYVTASLGIGGFGPRDVYAGSEAQGTIYRIAHDGSSQSLFVSGLVGGVRSIAFDPYGAYGHQMIVATNAGYIYKVDNTGAATLLAQVGEDAEGLSFAPQAFGTYGAGTLFVASENSGTLRAIGPGGAVSVAVAGIGGAEMVSFVPLNLGASGSPVEGFYAAAYPANVQKADASQFLPYLGDAIVTSETSHQIWQIHYDSATSAFDVNQIGTFPAQPEDGIFVTTDLIRSAIPEPTGLALMLAGLGLVGGVRRRSTGRKNAQA